MLAASAPRQVIFRFSDGVERLVSAAPDAIILDEALAKDVPLLFQCRSGTCASCLATLVAGCAPVQAGAASVLLPGEAAAGARLLCRTKVETDCTFRLDYDSAVGGSAPRTVHAFVDRLQRIASDAVRLTLELAEGDWLDFRPGQFVQLRVPGTDQWRSYSIASTPATLPIIELLIRLIPGGAMTNWLLAAPDGETVVEMRGPYGSFFLQDHPSAQHILVAGGTGLAPMIAMIDALRARPGRKPPVLLSFGCGSREGLFFDEELELRQLWMPTLQVRTSIERGASCSRVGLGNPVAAITADDIRDPDAIAYLCGPPGMVEAGRAHLLSLGLAAANIHAEQFVASA